MIKTILFDLDGTLLGMDQDEFVRYYFSGLTRFMAPYGYDPQTLAKSIEEGVYAMYANQTSLSNEEVFWQVQKRRFSEKIIEDKSVFEQYYLTDFQNIAKVCPKNEKAVRTIELLKDQYQLILATNPLFPQIATKSRIRWAGLKEEDFADITTYENWCRCKPNPQYFEEILEKHHLDPSECLMVGNDVQEDLCARQAGIDVFLITDNLINRQNAPLDDIPHGSFEDLAQYIEHRNL